MLSNYGNLKFDFVCLLQRAQRFLFLPGTSSWGYKVQTEPSCIGIYIICSSLGCKEDSISFIVWGWAKLNNKASLVRRSGNGWAEMVWIRVSKAQTSGSAGICWGICKCLTVSFKMKKHAHKSSPLTIKSPNEPRVLKLELIKKMTEKFTVVVI